MPNPTTKETSIIEDSTEATIIRDKFWEVVMNQVYAVLDGGGVDTKDNIREIMKAYDEAISLLISNLCREAVVGELKYLKKRCKRTDTPMGSNVYLSAIFESEIEDRIAQLKPENESRG